MRGSESTRWTLVHGAAAGHPVDRAEFVRHYVPVIRAYLGARWRGTPLLQEMDDAMQDVFVDCFAENGALTRAEPGRPGGFRAYLSGVVRNIALRVEERKSHRKETQPDSKFEPPADDSAPAEAFDRAWALSIMQQAGARMAERSELHFMLWHWKQARSFAAVRNRVGDLPEEEAAAWRAFRADVDAGLARTAPAR